MKIAQDRGVPPTVAVVVGNPKTPSRTSEIAAKIATRLVQPTSTMSSISVIELGPLAGRVFSWDDPEIAAAKSTVLASDLLVVASPVYKASYTGLLKAFIDHFGKDELAAKPTIPVMVGAAPDHCLAVEQQLRPVLVEVGASCPTRGVFVLESQLERLDELLTAWLGIWGDVLVRCVAAG